MTLLNNGNLSNTLGRGGAAALVAREARELIDDRLGAIIAAATPAGPVLDAAALVLRRPGAARRERAARRLRDIVADARTPDVLAVRAAAMLLDLGRAK